MSENADYSLEMIAKQTTVMLQAGMSHEKIVRVLELQGLEKDLARDLVKRAYLMLRSRPKGSLRAPVHPPAKVTFCWLLVTLTLTGVTLYAFW